jgi:hypothetical protein
VGHGHSCYWLQRNVRCFHASYPPPPHTHTLTHTRITLLVDLDDVRNVGFTRYHIGIAHRYSTSLTITLASLTDTMPHSLSHGHRAQILCLTRYHIVIAHRYYASLAITWSSRTDTLPISLEGMLLTRSSVTQPHDRTCPCSCTWRSPSPTNPSKRRKSKHLRGLRSTHSLRFAHWTSIEAVAMLIHCCG